MSNMPFGSAGLLGRRGCHRTAAEVSRLLLSLAPESDPCCSLLAFDYYCLRSREPDRLLLPFVGRLLQHPSLLLLPSYAFSVALAKHAVSMSSEKLDASASATKALQLASMQQLLHVTDPMGYSAEELAYHALGLYPKLLGDLAEKCGAPAAALNGVLKHALFTALCDVDRMDAGAAELVCLQV